MSMTPNELHFIQDSFREVKASLVRIEDKVDHQDQCTDELKVIVRGNALKDDERFEKLSKDMQSMVPNGDYRGHHDWHFRKMTLLNRFADMRWKFVAKVVELTAAGFFGWFSINLMAHAFGGN